MLCKWFIYITTSSTISLPSIFCFLFFYFIIRCAVLVQRRHVILMIISKRCRNMELLSIYIFMKNYTLSMPCVHRFFRVNVYSLQYFTSWFIALRRIQLNHILTLKIHHQIKASVINPIAEIFEKESQFLHHFCR